MSESDRELQDYQEEPFEEDGSSFDHSMVENHDDPVLLYLREIGDIEILHAEDEFRLAVLIQAGRAADRYLEEGDGQTSRKILREFTAFRNEYRSLLGRFNRKAGSPAPEADLSVLLTDAASISPAESREEHFALYTYMNLNPGCPSRNCF